jgi:hypothetical protein
MALVGSLTTMLLHESFIAAPRPPRSVSPRKVVERKSVEPIGAG